MTKFPKSFSKIGRSAVTLAVLATLSISVNIANAQTTTLPGVTTSTATPPPVGINFKSWSGTDGKSEGFVTGGDGKGTTMAFVESLIKNGVDSKLTGFGNTNCVGKCEDYRATMYFIGEQQSGVRTVNQGGPGLVGATAKTFGEMAGSAQTSWVYITPPAAAPAAAKP